MWLKLLFLFICTNVIAADPPLTLYDEGSRQGVVFKVDCTGSGVTCSKSGITGTVNVTGSGSSGWTLGASNVGISTTNAVGIGTSLTTTSGLTVMNGNVGIGTWKPTNQFQVSNNASIGYANTAAPTSGLIVSGNVGIGTTVTGQTLGLGGTIETTASTVLNQIGSATNLDINAGNSTNGIRFGRKTNAAGFSVEVMRGNDTSSVQHHFEGDGDSYMQNVGGNLGIGVTNTTPKSKLSVLGNVGIGTGVSSNYILLTAPNGGMIVENNVGIGTWTPNQKLEIGGSNSKIKMYDSNGVAWSCGPIITTGAFTCT